MAIRLRHLKRILPQGERGAALIISYLVLALLVTLMAGFAFSTVTELKQATRYRDSAQAFWAAQGGLSEFIQNQSMLDGGDQTVTIGGHSVYLSKDDSDPTQRLVTATAVVNGVTRVLQITFPANPPYLFSNTMSSGGNLDLTGAAAKLEVDGPTRLTGTFSNTGFLATATFQDKQEGVPAGQTTLKYPDANNNGTADEFNDFVQFNRTIAASYPSDEVVYIQSDNTQLIYPDQNLNGKKIIFVEGSAPGKGSVDILFDSSWADNQNMTIITTGDVNYIQPLQIASNSQLNVISWNDYNEASILYSAHTGVTYAHDAANFYSIFSYSQSTGNLVANQGVNANETLSWKQFKFANPLDSNGNVPPGFQGLISTASPGYASTPSSWKEL